MEQNKQSAKVKLQIHTSLSLLLYSLDNFRLELDYKLEKANDIIIGFLFNKYFIIFAQLGVIPIMNLKEEILILEQNFSKSISEALSADMSVIPSIVPPQYGDQKAYANKTFDEKTKALSDMFRAGRYLRNAIVTNDDGKGGKLFEPAIRQRLEMRIMNGFKQLYKLIDELTKEVEQEEGKANVDMRKSIRKNTEVQSRVEAGKSNDAIDKLTEAYFDQDMKKEMAPAIKKLMQKYGLDGGLSVRNNSTVVLNVRKGNIDFENDYNTEKVWNGNKTNPWDGYLQVSKYNIDSTWKKDSKAQKFLEEAYAILDKNNYDRSDVQRDHFDVGHYTDINIGAWNKPYEYTGVRKSTVVKPVAKKSTKPQDKFLLMIADKFGELSEYLEDSIKDAFLDKVHEKVNRNQYIAIETLINEVNHCADVNVFYDHLEKENNTLARTLDEKTMDMLIDIAKKL